MAEALFNLQAVFDPADYLFTYGPELTEARAEAEVEWLVKLLKLERPLAILDMACGFGRHANRLAGRGHRVTGVDLMPGFLEVARREAEAQGVQVDYRQGDMRSAYFTAVFDVALLWFTSFGYFEEDENIQVLRNLRRALKPGGRLLFDTPNRDVILKDLLPAEVVEREGGLVINRPSFDPLTGRFTNRRILIRDGMRKDEPYSIRLYNATEIMHLLRETGLEDIRLLGEDGHPLSAASRRMVVLVSKALD